MNCVHKFIIKTIRDNIIEGDCDATYREYTIKATLATFTRYFTYFQLIDLTTNIQECNKILNFSTAKLLVLKRMSMRDIHMYMVLTINVPIEYVRLILNQFPQTPRTITAAFCATDITVKHLLPLNGVMSVIYKDCYELLCVLNTLWKMGKFSMDHALCCLHGRALYMIGVSIMQTDQTYSILDLVNQVRYHVDLPAVHRVIATQSTLNVGEYFKRFLAHTAR